jgi:phosphatidylserine decarboxylase
MKATETPPGRARVEPLPENFAGVQPGGGFCLRVELAWGRWRRGWLRRFRPGYVRRMAELRRGPCDGAPHEILDPRDLKYCRNLCACEWDAADDPFGWRERLPLARWGLAEWLLIGGGLLVLAAVLALWSWWAALPAVALSGLVAYFFRDPPRRVPQEPGAIVAPADGKVVEIDRLDHDEHVGGPAVRIGVFLSIFDVHLNRSPSRGRVVALRYEPGKFLNALKARSARENENTTIVLEEETPPHRRMVVRQISGAIARRIVCAARAGEVLERGAKFGMIKFGSRTELILPASDDLEITVEIGAKIKAGSSVVARYGAAKR